MISMMDHCLTNGTKFGAVNVAAALAICVGIAHENVCLERSVDIRERDLT